MNHVWEYFFLLGFGLVWTFFFYFIFSALFPVHCQGKINFSKSWPQFPLEKTAICPQFFHIFWGGVLRPQFHPWSGKVRSSDNYRKNSKVGCVALDTSESQFFIYNQRKETRIREFINYILLVGVVLWGNPCWCVTTNTGALAVIDRCISPFIVGGMCGSLGSFCRWEQREISKWEEAEEERDTTRHSGSVYSGKG